MVKRPAPPVPPKTRTLPESMQVAHLDGPDVVTALRVFGTGIEFPLSRDVKTFTLGSGTDRDLSLPEGHLSALHCVLDRRGTLLRVTDQNSHNGTFFDGRREQTFELRPGGVFTAGPLTFLALNDDVRRAYPTLVGILGPEDELSLHPTPRADESPSAMIVLATSGRNVLLTGEAGCGQDRLARIIHDISLLRGRDPVVLHRVPTDRAKQRELLDHASRSTLILPLDAASEVMDAAFVSSVFSTSFRIRVVAIAPTVDKANDVLTADNVRSMRVVRLQPLAFRSGSIPALMDQVLVEQAATFRFSDLTPVNQTALRTYGWPRNFDDLRLVVQRLDSVAREPSLRKAAEALDLGHSTLHQWFTQLGLSQPLLDNGKQGRK